MILLSYQAYKKDQGNASSFTVLGGRLTAGLALVGVLGTLVALFMLDGSGVQESIMVGVVFFVLISAGYVVASRRLGDSSVPTWMLCTRPRSCKLDPPSLSLRLKL